MHTGHNTGALVELENNNIKHGRLVLKNGVRAPAGHVINMNTVGMHAEDSRFVKDAQRLQVALTKTQFAALDREAKKVCLENVLSSRARLATPLFVIIIPPDGIIVPATTSLAVERAFSPRAPLLPLQPEKAAIALANSADADKDRVLEALAAAQKSFKAAGVPLGHDAAQSDDDGGGCSVRLKTPPLDLRLACRTHTLWLCLFIRMRLNRMMWLRAALSLATNESTPVCTAGC